MHFIGGGISGAYSYVDFSGDKQLEERPGQVRWLAEQSLRPLLADFPDAIGHVVVSTTCPDRLAPSLGQELKELFPEQLASSHAFDLVQGCAGGVSALLLGSQLSAINQSPVAVVVADAARKAVAATDPIRNNFGNGSFACVLDNSGTKGLLHLGSRQYPGLSEVVTVKAGHDADVIIKSQIAELADDPRRHLGLSMNNSMALQLIREAEKFYLDFIAASCQPDVMILHQVNPLILAHLRTVFSKYPLEFIDHSAATGNCGAASIGIAFERSRVELEGKKVMLCGFGTGGVITAGLWQN